MPHSADSLGAAQHRAIARARLTPAGEKLLQVGAPLLLIGALTWPMLFTSSTFYFDWITHLWFVWHQSFTIEANHLPSLFLNYRHAVFYPYYAFYGGTVYSLTGLLSLMLGNAPVETYVLTFVMGFTAAYGGWLWMARMAGLRGWRAQLPGLVFLTGAYYVAIPYSSGDWPAFTGVSVIPLMVASGLSVLRAERLRMWPAVALVTSTIVFFGSHSITILWGSTTMILMALAIVARVPQARRQITRQGVIRVSGLVIPALLINAWYLLPAIAYESHTLIGSGFGEGGHYWSRELREHMSMVTVDNLFSFSRGPALSGAQNSAVSLPILTIGWVLVSIAVFLRTGRSRTWLRMLLVISGVTALIGVVMTHAGLILALPQPYPALQYSSRLESFVLLGVTGAVLAALVLSQSGDRWGRRWTWAFIPILIVSAIGATEQAAAFPPAEPGVSRSLALESFRRLENDYTDAHLPHLNPEGSASVSFPPSAVHDNRTSAVVHLSPGQLVYSNIGGGPELVHVTGARIAGIDSEFNDVLEIGPSTGASAQTAVGRAPSAPTETITVSPADSLPVVLGRLLTLAAALVLATEFAALAVRQLHARRATIQAGAPGAARS
jgi:hypothetical protein